LEFRLACRELKCSLKGNIMNSGEKEECLMSCEVVKGSAEGYAE
jgi:hypothetical protein